MSTPAWLGSAVPEPAPSKISVLASYAYMRNPRTQDAISRLLSDDRIEMLIDSGAFTAFNAGQEIGLDEYMAFLQTWGHRVFGYLALDKVQDPAQTEINLRRMIDQGLKPIPVHVLGEQDKRMDELFKLSSWVACAGLRRPHRGAAPPEYVKQKMVWAAGRDVHWLGYTSSSMIRAFKPFSVDCASYKSAAIHGSVSFYLGSGRMVTVTMPEWMSRKGAGKSVTHADLRKAVISVDIDPTELDDPAVWRASNNVRRTTDLSLRSWVRYQIEMRQQVGTRLFLAAVDATTDLSVREVIDAVDWAQQRGLLSERSA